VRKVDSQGLHRLGGAIVPVTAASLAVAFALLLMPVSERDYRQITIAVGIALAVIALSTMWRVAPRVIELGVPLGYLLVVAILRDAVGGGSSGFGGLFLLPIIYLALFAPRIELFVGLGAMAAANIVPLLVIGKPDYPSTTWRGTLVQVGAAAVAGLTIHQLVGETRAHAAETAVQNERLKELDRMKDEFVSLVSHELRTPLTSIAGYFEMLTEEAAGSFNSLQESFIETIQRNVVRLSRLVDDLLFIARLDEGRVHLRLTTVDIGELLAQSADTAKPIADAKRVELSVELDSVPAIRGDRERLAQLLDNLVSNAVKFTPEGGKVAIRASNGGSKVRVEVADTGVGIPNDELECLFERFYRASTARASETPGTGLGLAISQSIAEAHGTQIDVASTLGEGTTFSVELPVA
jgi:signal transduction histidine kinase